MDDKTFILNLLNLSEGILKNNIDTINPIIIAFNGVTLTSDQSQKIKSSMLSFIDNPSTVTIATLTVVINTLVGLNKNYLLALLDVRFIDFANMDNVKKVVIDKLQDKLIVFDDDSDKYSYYYTLSNLAITLKDSGLIETAINLVQSL